VVILNVNEQYFFSILGWTVLS